MTADEKRHANAADKAYRQAERHIKAAQRAIEQGVVHTLDAGLQVPKSHLEDVVKALTKAEQRVSEM